VQRILIVTALVLAGAVGATAIPTAASAAPKQAPVCRTAKEKKRHKRADGTRCTVARKPAPKTTPVPPSAPVAPPVVLPAPSPAPPPPPPPSVTTDAATYAGGSVIEVGMTDVPTAAAGTHYRLAMVTGTLGSACGFGYARAYSTTVPTRMRFGVVTVAPVDGVIRIEFPPAGSTTVIIGLPIVPGQPVPVIETLGTRKPMAGWCLGPGQATLSIVPDDAPAGDAGTAIASAAFTVA
jgi:hypothetical protein